MTRTILLLASSAFAAAAAALPSEYERLEYLESTGTQYIDTGVLADDDNGFRLEFMCTQRQTTQFFCGSRNASGDTRCCIGGSYYTDDNIPIAYFGWNTLVIQNSERQNCSTQCVAEVNYLGSRQARFGAKVAALSTLTTQTHPFFLFAGNMRNSSPSTICGWCRIYSFAMTHGQATVLNLLPARRISDGVPGMYDTVGDSFYTNAGSGTFVAGPVVDEGGGDDPDPVVPEWTTPTNGVLLLTFDDANYDNWLAATNLFARYGARATFCPYGSLTADKLAKMMLLKDRGHTIGCHTVDHVNTDGVTDPAAWCAAQVEPQVAAYASVGHTARTLAYPNNKHTQAIDDYIVANTSIRRFRAADLAGGTYLAAQSGGDLAHTDECFTPVSEIGSLKVVNAIGCASYYNTDLDNLLGGIRRAAASNEVLAVFSHDIQTSPSSVGMPTAWLESILATASGLGMCICGMDEYPLDEEPEPAPDPSGPGVLPAGYTLLEYVESTGSQYVDTGVMSGDDVAIEMYWQSRMALKSSSDSKFCVGARKAYKQSSLYLSWQAENMSGGGSGTNPIGLRYLWGDYEYNSGIGPSDYVAQRISATEMMLGAVKLATPTAQEFPNSYSIYAFTINQAGSASSAGALMRLKWLRLTKDGTEVRRYLPVRRNSDSVAGLYDLVEGVFFPSASSTALVAGPVASSSTDPFEFSSKPAGDGVELKATLVEVTPETAFSTGDLYMQLAKKGSPLPAAAKVASGFAAGDTFTTNLTGFASSGTYAVRFTYVSSGSGATVVGDTEFSIRRAPVDVGSAVNVAMFSHRARVSFEAYEGASALADFPVLVRLSESAVANFSYDDLVDANDLVFADGSGHILASEVDAWDPNGESLIWVRVPSLAASTQIYMYYGTRSSYGAPCTSATNVWSKYVGVYHLGTGLSEAGGSGRDLVKPAWASVSQAGLLGECVTNALPTDLQNLRFPTPRTALTDATCFTVTAWFRPDSRSLNGARPMASKQMWNQPDGFEFQLLESGSTRALRARTQAADDNNQATSSYSADYIPHYTWTHIGARYDGGSLAVFDNGANIASGNKNAVTGDDCGYWGIFGLPSSTAQIIGGSNPLSTFQGWTLTGLADEVRVYNGAASDLWVKTEYDTVSNPTFSRVTVDTGWTGQTGFSVHIL